MREELVAIREEFATPRRTEIAAAWEGLEDEDLMEREEMVVTVTVDGYIKRTALDTFRAQGRGGKGRAGMQTKEEDAVTELFVTSTHTPVLFFTTAGRVFRLKVWKPAGGRPRDQGPAGGEPSAGAGGRTRRSPPCCRCRRTRAEWSGPARPVRHRARLGPTQLHGRLHQRAVQRQARHALR